jgi:L-seryl-tRNA(Ser) seleniumtransferase
MTDPRRHIPSVDALLGSDAFAALLDDHPRGRVVETVRQVLDEARRQGGAGSAPDPESLADPGFWARAVQDALQAADRPSLRPVLNATGVVLHTNLGRTPLAASARRAMETAATGYLNLELDLQTGARGSRYDHCVDLLTELTGAEDALVVNNCAAALLLALNTVARGAGVLVSRGELVEIGGGFRIPEILERSGATLVEVGSTNRTRAGDYREALEASASGPAVRALLKVHRSNFRITGFAEEASLTELAGLARKTDLPLLFDLGSGLLFDAEALGLPPEPRAPEALARGADLVVFSGDKLLGGPQAGVVVGRADLVDAMRRNPLCRALRVDKVTLAGLEATLRLYRDPECAVREIPVLRMLAVSLDELEARARELVRRLGEAGLHEAGAFPGKGAVGGGTYPGVELDSWTVRLPAGARGPDEAARLLRMGDPAVVGRIEEDRLVVDLRTVPPGEDEALFRRLVEVARGGGPE